MEWQSLLNLSLSKLRYVTGKSKLVFCSPKSCYTTIGERFPVSVLPFTLWATRCFRCIMLSSLNLLFCLPGISGTSDLLLCFSFIHTHRHTHTHIYIFFFQKHSLIFLRMEKVEIWVNIFLKLNTVMLNIMNGDSLTKLV